MKKVAVSFLCLFAFCKLSASKSRLIELDSLLQSFVGLSDSAKADSLVKLGRHFVIEGQPENTIILCEKALEISRQKKIKDVIPKARFYLAAGFDEVGMLDSAYHHYKISLIEMKGTAYENWAVHVYINITNYLRESGNFPLALDYQFKGLEICKKEKDSFNLANFTSNIGYTYDRMYEFEEAITWQKKALPLFKELGNSYGTQLSLSRIGIAFDELQEYDSAHHYNQMALSAAFADGDSISAAAVMSNIGNTYSKQKEWEKARNYLEKSVSINKNYRDQGNIAISCINLGYIYLELGEYQKSMSMLRQGQKSAKAFGSVQFMLESNYRLYQWFEKKGKLDSALHYYKMYEMFEDSLFNSEKSRQITNIRTKYETEKKEQQLEYQQLELEQKESEIGAQRNLNWLLFISLLLLIVFSLGFYTWFRSRKNAEMQKAIIKEQERGLEAVIDAQEEERKRISKDLHDGIGQQLSGLKMAMQKISEELKVENKALSGKMEDLTKIVSQSAEDVRSISHQMMPRVLSEMGLIPAIEDMLEKGLGHTDIKYVFEHLNIEGRLNERIEISLYRVCQELINNVLKHAQATLVHVQIFKNKNRIIMVVEDNGKGIASSIKSDGHGLMNIRSRLSTLDGDVNFEESPGSGMLATVRIPLNE